MDENRSVREAAEKKISEMPKISPGQQEQPPEQLIHELQVHQVELEMQADELRRTRLDLEESRDKYLDLYEFAPVGYLTLTDKGLVEEVNLTGATLLGVERKELQMASFRKFIAPEDSDTWTRYFMNVRSHGEKQSCTLTLKKGDGSTFPARLEGVRVTRNSGAIIVRVSINDITDIRQVENALLESGKRYREFFTLSRDGVFITSPDGQWIDFNDATLELFGYGSREELSSVPISRLYSNPGERSAFIHLIERNGRIREYPVRLTKKDGTVIDTLITTEPVRNPDGSIKAFIGTVRDITLQKRAEEALAESEEHYRSLYVDSRDAVMIVSPERGFLAANPATIKLFGCLDEQDFTTRAPASMSPEYQPDGMLSTDKSQEMMRLALEKGSHYFEWTHYRADGTAFPATVLLSRFASGGKQLLQATVRDITAWKRTEEALAESEKKFRGIFDMINDGIHINEVRPDGKPGKFIEVNEVACRMLQYTREELLNHGPLDFVTGYHDPPLDEILEELSLKGHAFFETEHRRKDGTVFPVEINAHVVNIRGNQVVASVVRDITERKRDEEALQLSEEKHRLLIENSHDIIYTINPEGSFTFVSPSWSTHLGHPVDQVIGKPFAQFVHPDDIFRCLQFMRNVFSTGQQQTGIEYRVKHIDGSWRWHITNAVPLRDEAGTIIGGEGSASDITGRKQAEETLRQANKKLNLLSGITRHDINNQLMALIGNIEILERKQPDPSFKTYFNRINRAADQIHAMIQFTKEYENIGIAAPTWQGTRELVDKAAKQAPLGKVTVKNDLPAGREVFADPLIVKVFYNVMDNAARYGGTITTIRFTAEEYDGNYIIVCEDDGGGVPTGEKEKIFERGFGRNTGLGLALAREILDITGITIRETGEPGKGARFEMTVPKEAWRTTPGAVHQ